MTPKMRSAAAVMTLLCSQLVHADLTVGDRSIPCAEDPACINRIHPDIPMVVTAEPGERIVFEGRDAADAFSTTPHGSTANMGVVHPLTGPIHIKGVKAGDVLAVTLESMEAGSIGWTEAGPYGFAGEQFGTEERTIFWRINQDYAVSDELPGVRIPNAGFPGVITTLPGPDQLAKILHREKALMDLGGDVLPPSADQAYPGAVCGAEGSNTDECLRTIPPREHGGNLDIRYMTVGTTIYLPCHIDGCGLAVGDFHYAQGDGEVSGTAIEMGGTLTVTTQILKDGPDLSHGPQYEGPSSVLRIPSERFYAVTGFPVKEAGYVPANMAYLKSTRIADLENLSQDIHLAARNALDAMIDHIMTEYGYDRAQAYIIASVAVDLRIGQLVDVPNVGVTAILPLDIFTTRE